MYEQGYEDALALLGLPYEKTAGIGQGLRAVGRWAKSKLPTLQGVKEFFVGNPGQFWNELRSGTALKPEGLIRQGMKPQGNLDKLLFVGMPAYDTARTALDDEGNKAERIGRIAGGNLLGLAAWKPLGMVGSMAAGTLGDIAGGYAGRSVGRGIDALRGKTPQEPSGNPNPYVY